MTDLLEFIVGLNPRVQYPPEELDREPVVILDQSMWEAIVDDARAAIEAMQPDDDDGDMLTIASLAGAHDAKRDAQPSTPQEAEKVLLDSIMVWYSTPNHDHHGTWSTTRYPEGATEYVSRIKFNRVLKAAQLGLDMAKANDLWNTAEAIARAIAGEDQT